MRYTNENTFVVMWGTHVVQSMINTAIVIFLPYTFFTEYDRVNTKWPDTQERFS